MSYFYRSAPARFSGGDLAVRVQASPLQDGEEVVTIGIAGTDTIVLRRHEVGDLVLALIAAGNQIGVVEEVDA